MKHKIRKILLTPILLLVGILNNIGTWVFEYASRVIELLNTWCLIGFGFVMFINSSSLFKLELYGNFTIAPKVIWLSMIGLGVVQFVLLCQASNKSNQLSAIVLQLSAIIWMIIAMAFAFAPPISTALPLYTGLSFVTGCTGYELLRISKELEE